MIRYFASPIQNAYGSACTGSTVRRNPRGGGGGGDLPSDGTHNVMNLLRNWYFIQDAAANPEARKGTQWMMMLMG